MIEAFGWFGALSFAICGIPQAWQCYRQGHAEGLNNAYLWLWMGGEIGLLVNVVFTQGFGPLLVNYVSNGLVLSVIIRYRYWPVDKKGHFVQ